MKTKQASNLKPGDVAAIATLVQDGRGGITIGKTWATVIALEPREGGVGFDIAGRPTTGRGTAIIRQYALPTDPIEVQ